MITIDYDSQDMRILEVLHLYPSKRLFNVVKVKPNCITMNNAEDSAVRLVRISYSDLICNCLRRRPIKVL